MYKVSVCLLSIFMLQAEAAERVWSGGSAGNWSVAGNWSPAGVPENGDRLVFNTGSGSANNDLTDLSLSGLAFGGSSGAYTLVGNRVTVGGITNASAAAQIFNLPVAVVGTAIFHGTGGSMRFNSEISGDGAITQTGPGLLLLYAANTFAGDYLVKTQACTRVYASNALGSTLSGQVVIEDGGWVEFNNSIEIGRGIDIQATTESSAHVGGIRAMSGTTTFRAVVKSNRSRIGVLSGNFVFAEGMTGNTMYTGGIYPYQIVFSKPLVLANTFYSHGAGVNVFEAQGNTWGVLMAQGGSVIFCSTTNALPADKEFAFYGAGTLDLNGFNQTVPRFWSALDTCYVLSTNAPATLTVNSTSDGTLLRGQFVGKAALLKRGSGALIFGLDQQSVGPFVVEAGRLVFSNALATCTNVTVRGGTLELVRDPKMAANASFEITSPGQAVLGEQVVVQTFIVDGVTMPSGTYGSGESPAETKLGCLSGKGYVVVTRAAVPITQQAVWDAGGGTGDTSASNPANWAGDVLPTLDEATALNFTAGTVATFADDITVGSVEFNTGAAFLVNGAGRINVGQGGLQVKNNPASVTYTIENDLRLIVDQTWFTTNSIDPSKLTAIAVKGKISNKLGFCNALKLTGLGVFSFYGESTFIGDIALASSNTCAQVYHNRAFGDAKVSITNFAIVKLYGGLTLTNQFTLFYLLGRGTYSTILGATGTNTLAGPIISLGNGGRLTPGGAAAPMIVSGGVTGGHLYTDATAGGGYLLVTNKPIAITGTLYVHNGGDRILAVSGNTWGGFNNNDNGQSLICTVPNAMPTNTAYDTGRANLNIGGFNQTIGRIKSVNAVLPQLIASSAPAILTINQTSSELFRGQFTNAIGFIKQGASTLTLSHPNHFFSGPATVREGQLALTNSASLGAACTNIIVSGGSISAATDGAWSRNAFVSLAGTGKLQLATGTRQEALQLFVNGKLQPSGTYGSTTSSAQYTDNTHFSGTGVLYVRRGYPATRLILR